MKKLILALLIMSNVEAAEGSSQPSWFQSALMGLVGGTAAYGLFGLSPEKSMALGLACGGLNYYLDSNPIIKNTDIKEYKNLAVNSLLGPGILASLCRSEGLKVSTEDTLCLILVGMLSCGLHLTVNSAFDDRDRQIREQCEQIEQLERIDRDRQAVVQLFRQDNQQLRNAIDQRDEQANEVANTIFRLVQENQQLRDRLIANRQMRHPGGMRRDLARAV